MYKPCKKIRCEHLKNDKCSFGDLCIFTSKEMIEMQEIRSLNFWLKVIIGIFIIFIAITLIK